MCHFLSAIFCKNGDLICQPEYTDGHEDLIAWAGLKDDGSPLSKRGWVRVEFTPPADHETWTHLSKWTLTIDEQGDPPKWFDADKARGACAAVVERMFVKKEQPVLLGGCWIVCKGGKIGTLRMGRIVATLTGATLTGATLTGANLTGATLTGATLTGANLYGANLDGANLTRATLTRANLTRATLTRANLTGANLTRANLDGANLDGANLDRANLTGANLYGANLDRANLTGANLTGAYRPASDPLPSGWVRSDAGYLSKEPAK
jgi:hypothetical protein